MEASNYSWVKTFRVIFDRAVEQYRSGSRDYSGWFSEEQDAFLRSIGCRRMDLLDYAEDLPDIDWETALLITSARRDYFLHVQEGHSSSHAVPIEQFPGKDEEMAGIPWLPRIILKARAKLRGELPEDLMYCCGGDRNFLSKHNIHPSDFLRLVWSAGEDDARILEFVRESSSGATD